MEELYRKADKPELILSLWILWRYSRLKRWIGLYRKNSYCPIHVVQLLMTSENKVADTLGSRRSSLLIYIPKVVFASKYTGGQQVDYSEHFKMNWKTQWNFPQKNKETHVDQLGSMRVCLSPVRSPNTWSKFFLRKKLGPISGTSQWKPTLLGPIPSCPRIAWSQRLWGKAELKHWPNLKALQFSMVQIKTKEHYWFIIMARWSMVSDPGVVILGMEEIPMTAQCKSGNSPSTQPDRSTSNKAVYTIQKAWLFPIQKISNLIGPRIGSFNGWTGPSTAIIFSALWLTTSAKNQAMKRQLGVVAQVFAEVADDLGPISKRI